MTRDPRYDILFEPIDIGPLTARNRFFQVPHCNGMDSTFPSTMATMRGMKAEGGWAVVCTEETEIHPTSDISPIIEERLWDGDDISVFARVNELVHLHGALTGIELTHTGHRDSSLYSREVPMSVSALPVSDGYPIEARAMDKADIRDYRRWHRNAALREEPPEDMTLRLHPRLSDVYASKVRELERVLNDPSVKQEAIELIRRLIERIELKPRNDTKGLDAYLYGDLARVLAFYECVKQKLPGANVPGSQLSVVAGACKQRESLIVPVWL